jgi:ABC-2 type transport system ATP-binding protein
MNKDLISTARMDSSMDHIAVVSKDLTRIFGDFVAVDHVTFEVEQGEIFGFLGPNGAGKTTTIKILCGLLTPSSGTGTVAGFDVSTQSEDIKKNIGYMSQKFSLYEDLKVSENLDFFGGIYGLDRETKRRRSSWVLEMAGLTDQTETITRSLPLGWKQRLALGCAILHEPPVIFLDEPTSGVDPLSRRNFWELINDLASQGVTVFVTTHYMEEAEYCNRLALMSSGKIVALGTPSDLKTNWMPETVIDLECDQVTRVSELLKKESIFSEAAVFGSSIHLVTQNPEEAKEKTREILAKEGIIVERLEIVVPSLEDVFVTLTSPAKK